jgi:hypothetical protein
MTILLALMMVSAIAEAQGISQVLLIPREGESANMDLRLKKEVGVMMGDFQKTEYCFEG